MLNVFKAAKQIQNIMSIEIIVIKKALDSSFTVHHIATIRRPWPHIPGAASTVSHTGSEDLLVFLPPQPIAWHLLPSSWEGSTTCITLKQQTNRLM